MIPVVGLMTKPTNLLLIKILKLVDVFGHELERFEDKNSLDLGNKHDGENMMPF